MFLKDRTAAITGSTSGIGLAYARALAAEGANLVINGIMAPADAEKLRTDLEKEFGIKVPLEKWTQEVNDGKASTDEYFVMKNLCAKIDELRAAKG